MLIRLYWWSTTAVACFGPTSMTRAMPVGTITSPYCE